jgi:hypothetical protein
VEHLSLHALPDGLHPKYGEYLADVVAGGPGRVHVWVRKDRQQSDSVSFQHPFLDSLDLPGLCEDHSLLVLGRRQMHVHLGDGLDSLQGHVSQHVGLDTPQEHVILHLINLLFLILHLVVIRAHNPDPQHQFLRIIIVKNTVQIVSESSVDLLCDRVHRQLLVSHPLPVQLDPEEPGTESLGVDARHLVVDVHPLVVLLDHRVGGVRVVVYCSVGSHLAESRVLHTTQHVFALLGVSGRGAVEEDGERGSPGLLGDVDDLLQSRHSECYVLGRHSGEMESVECHLSGRFSKTLRCQRANHLSRGRHGHVEATLDFSYQPIESL